MKVLRKNIFRLFEKKNTRSEERNLQALLVFFLKSEILDFQKSEISIFLKHRKIKVLGKIFFQLFGIWLIGCLEKQWCRQMMGVGAEESVV